MASRLSSITGRSWGSCQISGEDVGVTEDTVGRRGLIIKLGSKKKIEYAQWANTSSSRDQLTIF